LRAFVCRDSLCFFAAEQPGSSVGGLRCASPGLLIARDHQCGNALDRVRADAERLAILCELIND
jgi:hypothetical protein